MEFILVLRKWINMKNSLDKISPTAFKRYLEFHIGYLLRESPSVQFLHFLSTLIPRNYSWLLQRASQWIETHAFRCVWGSMERLQRTRAYKLYTACELGTFHIPSRCAALRTKNTVSFFTQRNRPKSWVSFVSFWLDKSLRVFLKETSLNLSPLAENGPIGSYKNALIQFQHFIYSGGSVSKFSTHTKQAYRISLASVIYLNVYKRQSHIES